MPGGSPKEQGVGEERTRYEEADELLRTVLEAGGLLAAVVVVVVVGGWLLVVMVVVVVVVGC